MITTINEYRESINDISANYTKTQDCLYELIDVNFPNYNESLEFNLSENEFRIDEDETGDGSKILFVDICLPVDKYEIIENLLNNDYDNYVKQLESSVTNLEIFEINSITDQNIISVSMIYMQNFER